MKHIILFLMGFLISLQLVGCTRQSSEKIKHNQQALMVRTLFNPNNYDHCDVIESNVEYTKFRVYTDDGWNSRNVWITVKNDTIVSVWFYQ